MHRNVRRIRHQPAGVVEHGAREIQPLLDVDRGRRGLQRQSHFLSHAHEAVVEHLQQDGIGVRADGVRSDPAHPLEDQVAVCIEFSAATPTSTYVVAPFSMIRAGPLTAEIPPADRDRANTGA